MGNDKFSSEVERTNKWDLIYKIPGSKQDFSAVGLLFHLYLYVGDCYILGYCINQRNGVGGEGRKRIIRRGESCKCIK